MRRSRDSHTANHRPINGQSTAITGALLQQTGFPGGNENAPAQKPDQTDIRSYWRVATAYYFFPIAYRLTNRKESSGRLIKRYKFNIGGQITNAKLAEQARFSSRALDLLIFEEGDSRWGAVLKDRPESLSGAAFR
ncbi:hypothetical protein [Burkholderia perseverans]|uniref:hypothetical protein n=1 Tax=Burkholderia perseverans TaxID=2615214 RepID=UPI001FEF8544|nr:hypothetical protein [Burkholderia perseverans]